MGPQEDRTNAASNTLRLCRLRLRDFRCFEALDIDFHPELTVLVASNGAGKTSILDAIGVAFGPYVGAFDEAVGKHLEPSNIRQLRARRTATNEMESAPQGARLEVTINYFAEVAQMSPVDASWVEELEREVKGTAQLPFSTALWHVLTRQSG